MIEKLRLRNFRRYREATLNFQPGLNFIQGLNNAGKTTLFYAIEYALFGRVENFKTLRALLHPGKRSLGVELVFAGKNGERYLLQRVHEQPAKGRKTLEGHFTLKALVEDGERYVLSSDFGDTEDKLALTLHDLTGLTRRLFSMALHMRQGNIPAILEGAKELDIVLGVTAASMAEEELRVIALEFEKESARLPVLQERLRSIGAELEHVAASLASLSTDRQNAAEKLAALGAQRDSRAEIESRVKPLVEALTVYQTRADESKLHQGRLADEEKRLEFARQAGSSEALLAELAKLETETATRAKATKKLRTEMEAVDAEQRQLDQQRGDLAGRIERRRELPTGKGAKCEYCGAPIKAAQMAKELEEWAKELKQLDKSLTELQARQAKLRTTMEKENEEERKNLERSLQVKRQHDTIAELEASLAQRHKERDAGLSAEKDAFASVTTEANAIAKVLQGAELPVSWNLEGAPAEVVASIRHGLQMVFQAIAERVGRDLAERKALTDLVQRLEGQAQTLERRQSDLQRDQAATNADAQAQQVKAARAARFRRLCGGFKDLQVRLRSDAATRLAPDTVDLHRKLAARDEFVSLSVDPATYAVQVVPRDLGEQVPAGLYEGGGHRLLLGLAYRLAIARLVGKCPFLMLDEPTYGLDDAHRAALMERIAMQDVSGQVLLVTHHPKADVSGHRIEVVRRDKETVVAGA